MKEEILTLIRYRIKEALESLEESRILLNDDKTRGAMNRVYYSIFYAVLALLAAKQLSASKHSGVISLFHKEFVKVGLFPKELASVLDIAFDLRIRGDYRDFVVVEKEKVLELLQKAGPFIQKAQEVAEIIISQSG